MPPLSGSLTREEAAELLQLTPPMLDALLEGGQLLCHYRGGEPRIPVAQLESYLRDSLVRLYRLEARMDLPIAADDTRRPQQVPVDEEAFFGAPAPEREPPREQLEPQPDMESESEPEPEPQFVMENEPAEVTYSDTRTTPRYVPRRQITGIFHDVRFTIVQISATGLRIRHTEPLLPGDEAKLSFALLNPPRSFMMRARVVWTSAARYGNGGDSTFSISGLRVIEHAERLVKAVELLLAAHDLEPDRRQNPRPGYAADAAMTPAAATDDEIALVLKATQRFAADPLEATRWYGRGKFALSDEHVRRAAPPKPRDREEALAVWEFLERQVALEKVSSILAWSRKARPAAAAGSSAG
jgi:hypothetical protein